MHQLLVTVKRHLWRTLLSVSILFFFLFYVNGRINLPFLDELELKTYDMRLQLTMPNTLDPRIVIVDIDEKSLSEIGRWPWNRSVLAKIVNQLFDNYHINMLGFDVVFAESDESSGLKILQNLAQTKLQYSSEFLTTVTQLQDTLDYDRLFADSLHDRRIVLGYTFISNQQEPADEIVKIGKLPQPLPNLTNGQVDPVFINRLPAAQGYAANLAQFQDNALYAGHFDTYPDEDGIVRRAPLFYQYKGNMYELLSLAMARIALDAPESQLIKIKSGNYINIENIKVGNRIIPVDKYLRTLVPYRGQQGSFTYVSASDILHGRITDPNILTNKIVLIGTTARGLQDVRATPVSGSYPGVEVHANIIAGILDGNIMQNPAFIHGLEIMIIFLVGMIMIILLPLLSPLTSTIATLTLLIGVVILNLTLWIDLHWVLPITATILTILSLFIFNMSYGFFVETTNKRHLTQLFGQYIPPELVDEMNQNLDRHFSMEGESREMTVLFSDVRGFTTISEGLSPKELSELMNAYLTPMTKIIHEHRGTIDKYMGDAIMAFWGAPLQDEQHATRALDAAMAMIKQLKAMQPEFKAHGWPEIKIGVGLNTGIMSVGNMGSKFRMAYTVLGDAVNLGSRLEGITKQYGVQVIVSETTKAKSPNFAFRELDRVRVKGKDQPVAIFEPIDLLSNLDDNTQNELTRYEEALEHYRQQNWPAAQSQLNELQQQVPTRLLYKIYAERVNYFMENPPGENWDGVYTFTTK